MNLTDNTEDARLFNREDVSHLFPISGKPISQLCKENRFLLVFPQSIELTNDKLGDLPVLNILSSTDPDKVRISTGNAMGFIGIRHKEERHNLSITSRFDSGRDNYFLHYMLQRVLSFNLFDMPTGSDKDTVFDFLMLLFPYLLKNALRKGVYKEYRTFRYNDAKVRGAIDVSRHIASNMPFVGNIAYRTREYSHDNDMTELIRHTIDYMHTKPLGRAVLNIDRDTTDGVKLITQHTPSYNKSERAAIVSRNLRRKSHPFYTEYQPLQTLCLQILRRERVKYGDSDDDISGILFDGAWLWEEYVNTILKPEGFIHPENKLKKGGIYLFSDNTGLRYPDFYNDHMVLDAKYKRFERYNRLSNVDRDDLHQLIAYVTTMQSPKGGFVVPMENEQTSLPHSELKGTTSTLYIFGIEISKTATSYSDFCKQMKEKEESFLVKIRG